VNKKDFNCLLIVSIDWLRLIIGSAFQRRGILLKNEFLEALFIDKVCFILFALPSRLHQSIIIIFKYSNTPASIN